MLNLISRYKVISNLKLNYAINDRPYKCTVKMEQFICAGKKSVICQPLKLWTILISLSNEPPERPASSWQRHACGVFKTHHSAAAQRRPRGPRPHKGLQQLTAAPLQEAWLQKLLQHLPTLCNAPPLQHTVSAAARVSFSFPLFPPAAFVL